MDVRRARNQDRDRLLPLIRAYFDFYETPFPAARIVSLLDSLEADESLGIQLVAVAGRPAARLCQSLCLHRHPCRRPDTRHE